MSAAGRRRGGAVRRLGANLALACASVLLTLGAFEVGLRCAGYRPVYETYSKPSLFWVHDPVLGWSHQPGSRGKYVGPRPWPIEFQAPIEINALGLRGPDLPDPRPAAEQRVLVLGDSMVASFEVPWEETFLARLQAQLSDELDRPIQVINAGVRGYGTDQSLLYYRHRGRLLEPDVVVFLYSNNDLNDNTTLHEMRRPFGKAAYVLREDGSLELVGFPVRRYPACSEVRVTAEREATRVDGLLTRAMCHAQMVLLDRSALVTFVTMLVPWEQTVRSLYYLASPHLRYDANRAGEAKGSDPGSSANGHGAARSERYSNRLTRELVTQMARDVERDGAAFVMLGQGAHLAALDTRPLEAAGIEIINLDAIEGRTPSEIRFRRDSHYNTEGHARLAAFLAPRLRELLEGRSRKAGAGS